MPRGTSGFRRRVLGLRYRVTFTRKERPASARLYSGGRRDWAYTYIGCLAGRSRLTRTSLFALSLGAFWSSRRSKLDRHWLMLYRAAETRSRS